MPAQKYDDIYKSLKKEILNNQYKEGDYLPSETILTAKYDCSRNTVRRAISHLASEGYVQAQHGKGVRVIHHESPKFDFLIHGTEGFNHVVKRYGHKPSTKVIIFTDLLIDERLSKKTGFPAGTSVYYIQRVRSIDSIPKMVDTNLIRKDLIPGLTKKIASGSLFSYIENELGIEIVTIKRTITVERVTPFDESYLELDNYNCLAVITSRVYNASGDMFEYSESRNRPDIFMFNSVLSKNGI